VIDFGQRVTDLEVEVGAQPGGRLHRGSQYEFDYLPGATRPASLLMPVEDRHFRDGELFAVMDMNLPEGFLLAQLRERAPRAPPTKLQLLELSGSNGIGRLGFRPPGAAPSRRPRPVSRRRLLREGSGRRGAIFLELVDAYLSTGAGLSGVQPKVLVPDRAAIPVPNVLVKAGGGAYPGLAANEFLCLEVARRAGLAVPRHELSDDGTLLLIDRFDLHGQERLGFEDLAALMDLRVGGALSDRKYRGSYQSVTRLLALFCTDPGEALAGFFDQLALSVLVRNGDAHLKNFGVLYDDQARWLAPLFDVVTTTLYPYQRGAVSVVDRTMALRLENGGERGYPMRAPLEAFGRDHCRLPEPGSRLEALREAMAETLEAARPDHRIPRRLLKALSAEWGESARVYR
jgi:serine/threonine-protein kinase HipA